jgi:hypothetical protein
MRDSMPAFLGQTRRKRKFSPTQAGVRLPFGPDRCESAASRVDDMLRPTALACSVVVAVSTTAVGCNQSGSRAQGEASAKPRIRGPVPSIAALLTAGPSSSAPVASKELEEPDEQSSDTARAKKAQPKIGSHRVVLDELVDVAPAGPSAATPAGVLLVTRAGRTLLAPLRPEKTNLGTPTRTPVSTLDVAATDLVALERGPAVLAGFAYFIHGGHLARSKLASGDIEKLADDARSYTRVALPDLPLGDAPTVVAYIARHATDKSTLIARLWVEGQGSVTLTPDGSAGNSVAIARTNNGYIAMSLESRTGMSPLHARRVSFAGNTVKLGSDVVPWLAGTAQALTEIHAIGDPSSVWALLPVERDATHFGLARIDLGLTPRMGAQVHWREYPNGVEPAVVTSGYLCDRPVVLYARPATAEPHATQELHLSSIGPDGLSPSTIVATSRAFADASFAGLDGGALVVYVADHRTWARRLRCVP